MYYGLLFGVLEPWHLGFHACAVAHEALVRVELDFDVAWSNCLVESSSKRFRNSTAEEKHDSGRSARASWDEEH